MCNDGRGNEVPKENTRNLLKTAGGEERKQEIRNENFKGSCLGQGRMKKN